MTRIWIVFSVLWALACLGGIPGAHVSGFTGYALATLACGAAAIFVPLLVAVCWKVLKWVVAGFSARPRGPASA
jgi:hypothetical protein